QLYVELEDRVRLRTAELEAANRELESFAYSVSHDLRAPLRAVHGFSQAVLEDFGERIDEEGRSHLQRVVGAAIRMNGLIDALLDLSRLNRAPVERSRIDVTSLAREMGAALARSEPARSVRFVVQVGLVADADGRLVRALLDNLIGNAWKFTSRKA